MSKDIFCKIAEGCAPAKIRYEDDEIVAIDDINPKAPVHILIIPKKHYSSVTELSEADSDLIGKMILVAKKIAIKEGIDKNGYKLIFNVGKEGGQLVPHLHLHLLGGKLLHRLEV